jgi:hypothetical protein
MRPDAFESFFASLPGPMPPLSLEDTKQGLLGDLLSNYIATDDKDVTLLTSVRLADAAEFETLLGRCENRVPGLLAYNGRFFVRHMVALIYSEMERLGLLAAGFIVLILLIVVRRLRSVATMLLPLLASLLWTFGLMGWLGIQLNLMNSIVIVFIFGLVVDYAIFMTIAMRARPVDSTGSRSTSDSESTTRSAIRPGWESPDHLLRTAGAILISALTTLCGMGALLFAQHPALHTIGATALLGIATGVVSVLTIVPLLGRMKRSFCNTNRMNTRRQCPESAQRG